MTRPLVDPYQKDVDNTYQIDENDDITSMGVNKNSEENQIISDHIHAGELVIEMNEKAIKEIYENPCDNGRFSKHLTLWVIFFKKKNKKQF